MERRADCGGVDPARQATRLTRDGYREPPIPGIPEPPSQEAGLFQGVVVTLSSSFGVPSAFFPPPPEAQAPRRRGRTRMSGEREAGPNFVIPNQ